MTTHSLSLTYVVLFQNGLLFRQAVVHVVVLIEVEYLKLVEQEVTHVFVHVAVGYPSVEVIDDPPSIHHLAN